jgi:hypothetical protein
MEGNRDEPKDGRISPLADTLYPDHFEPHFDARLSRTSFTVVHRYETFVDGDLDA